VTSFKTFNHNNISVMEFREMKAYMHTEF